MDSIVHIKLPFESGMPGVSLLLQSVNVDLTKYLFDDCYWKIYRPIERTTRRFVENNFTAHA